MTGGARDPQKRQHLHVRVVLVFEHQPRINFPDLNRFGVFAGVLVVALDFADAVEQLYSGVRILRDRHRVGAAALPEGNTQTDGKAAGAFGKDRRNIKRRKLGRRRIIDLQAAGHDRAELVKTDTFVFQFVAREPGFDHAIRIRPGQPALGPDLVHEALLHPLKMVRLEKKPFLPVNFYRHIRFT